MTTLPDTVAHDVALETRVESVLESLRPMIARHGGNVELIGLTSDHVVELTFLGACADCEIADITLNDGLKTAIMLECPEVTDVIIA